MQMTYEEYAWTVAGVTKFEEPVFTVYLITNLLNGQFYFGKHVTKNLKDRYLGSGRRIKPSVAKYGKENFKKEVIHIFDNSKEALRWERIEIDKYLRKDPKCLNLMSGGGDYDPEENSENMQEYWDSHPERRETQSNALKSYFNTPEAKERLSKSQIHGYIANPERREKNSQAKTKYWSNSDRRKEQSERRKKYFAETPGASEKASEAAKKREARKKAKKLAALQTTEKDHK